MSTKTLEFKTEVKQLLDLMIHSLYSHKEIFLRELISNASDALDKARFEALTDNAVMEQDSEWRIRISSDREKGTLTVSDNGIGMTAEEISTALGTIAHSGTKEFLRSLKEKDIKDNPELIGQFGVGFYSAFMVADRVTVLSKKAGADIQAVRWESTADGTYTIEESEKAGQGTDVILHLKKEELTYLEEWEIRGIVKRYSDYMEYPVFLEVERQEDSVIDKGKKVTIRKDERINSGKAIWLREKSDVSEAEHKDFFGHLTHGVGEPLKVIHYKAEGSTEFVALLYVPAKAPIDLFFRDFGIGPSLYVRKVQIMDHCEELLPAYLRFVRGVVDSADLPLNVSREMLQSNRQAEIIRNSITKKVLDTLAELKERDFEKYASFFGEFGRVLKEGLHHDFARREAIADLLIFPSTAKEAGAYRTLGEYVADMKEGQEEIFFITAPSFGEAVKSPYREALKEKGYEVLIMLDEIDDLIFHSFDYKGKRFKSVIKGEVDLDKSLEKEKEKAKKKLGGILDLLREQLKSDVKDVRVSGRLRDSACCLVTDEADLDPRAERLLRAMGREVPPRTRILELNPVHPLFEEMNRIFSDDPHSELLGEYASLLYDQALILEGERPKDPALFAGTLSRLMTGYAKGDPAGHSPGDKTSKKS